MKLPALLVSDLHLTANPEHEYRWGLFKWLVNECASEGVKTLVIAGDLTDAKDYHPAGLTNRLVECLLMFTWAGIEVVVLQGNHDYLRAGHSYFAFLDKLERMRFITQPTEAMDDDGPSVMWLPHTKTPGTDWKGFDFSHYDLLFMHQTVTGAIASNGQVMDGEPMPPLNAVKVYSGDIHVPQVIKGVEYIGSPYHVHFGDRFKPRAILLDRKGVPHDLHFETISRVTLKVSSLRELRRIDWLKPGDHVKLRMSLAPSEKHEWSRIQREARAIMEKAQVELFGVELQVSHEAQASERQAQAGKTLTDAEVIEQFVIREDLGGDALDAALRVIA